MQKQRPQKESMRWGEKRSRVRRFSLRRVGRGDEMLEGWIREERKGRRREGRIESGVVNTGGK